ncbi:MAG: ATP-binding protein [Bacilli bacterium]|nr:ATP-binding protein [Bacilli bacterium]
MASSNPFSLEFGVQPPEYIDRFEELSEITEDFSSLYPSTHTYALLGPRGCGKTVLLNDIVDHLAHKEGWIAFNLNGKADLLSQLAGALSEKVQRSFPSLQAEFSFSFSFLSLTLKGKEKVPDIHVLLQKMLSALSRHNVNVLVGIDDVSVNDYIAVFVKEFQLLRGMHLPLFLIMTGLYDTFDGLQSQDGLTFLQRTPKKYLGPLSLRLIEASYQTILGVSKQQASELALQTKGYAFAYQCLGYLLIKEGKTQADESVLSKLDHYLEEGVYNKLWHQLSNKEKEILSFIARRGSVSNEDIFAEGLLTPSTISIYKSSLSKKGVVDASKRGYMSLALPRFAEFISSR